ncbi:Calcium-binding protein 39-like [Ranunculus cassubicifolius]
MFNLNCCHPSSIPKDPISILDFIHNTLIHLPQNPSLTKTNRKTLQLSHYITTLREYLYGSTESEPKPKICSQITQKFFARDTLRLIIFHFPQLNMQIRNDLYTLVTNLECQKDLVHSRFLASEYFEKNKDLVDKMILGYENKDCALQYGPMLRGAIKHQNIARYVLGKFEHMNKFFELLEIGNFGVSSDEWFFAEYKCRLLGSSVCINRRCAVQLLGDILRGKANAVIRRRYVSSLDNLKIVMNLLNDTSKITQMEAFRVFKLFVDNEDKPEEIVSVLAVPENKLRIVRLCEDLNVDKPYEHFEVDKARVVKIFKD